MAVCSAGLAGLPWHPAVRANISKHLTGAEAENCSAARTADRLKAPRQRHRAARHGNGRDYGLRSWRLPFTLFRRAVRRATTTSRGILRATCTASVVRVEPAAMILFTSASMPASTAADGPQRAGSGWRARSRHLRQSRAFGQGLCDVSEDSSPQRC
ncbi:MAG: hypothetical protein JWM36_2466 [Hyphomicrobiales bacterium]|nr:hypothetical protein [Hyphomicrobiales bacterium]